MERGLGWRPDLEPQHANIVAAMQRPMCAVSAERLPDNVDPGDKLTINDQRHFSSCSGNAIDKILEWDHLLEHKTPVNLSARFSYLAARTIDGTNSQGDGGASISGAARGAAEIGCVKEEVLPYWPDDNFDPTLSSEVLRTASEKKLRAICDIRSYDEYINFVGTGQGAVALGIWWTQGLANYRGGDPITSVGGGRLGGHAVAAIGYVTWRGMKCPKIWNSHGDGYGNKGTFWVTPDVFTMFLNGPFGAKGMSGSPAFTKRRIDLLTEIFT